MTEDPLASVSAAFACATRDQSLNARDAWVYGIVCGWDEDDGTPSEAMAEVAERHGWTADAVARLRRLRAKWVALASRRGPRR